MTQMLSESLEDYLEAIYHIVSAKQAARATDISRRLKVNRSSVTGALRSLAEKGLVNYAPYDIVTLTAEGSAAAKRVAHRHEVLKDFLTNVLSVDEESANAAACGMEHHVGRAVLGRLGCLAQFIAEQARADGGEWLRAFLKYCSLREADGSGGALAQSGDGGAGDVGSTGSGNRRRAK